MCTTEQLRNITAKMSDCYRKIYGDDIVKIVLYGSYARGNYTEFSDVDLVAIVNGERLTLQKKLNDIWDESAELGMENDVIISPTVIPSNEFEKYKNKLPYYRNIEQEGICVG